MPLLLDVNELLNEVESTPLPRALSSADTDIVSEADKKPAVLIATHSESTLKSIAITLESIGYQTYSATDAYLAAEWLQREPEIGLIIIDRKLPEFDGFQLCKMIRDADEHAPPVVILSRKMGLWSWMKAKAAGSAGLVLKPINPENLIATVRKQLPIPR